MVELTPIGRVLISWWQRAFRARMFAIVRTLRSDHLIFSLTFPHLGSFRERTLEKRELPASKNPSTASAVKEKTQIKRSPIHLGTSPGTLGSMPSFQNISWFFQYLFLRKKEAQGRQGEHLRGDIYCFGCYTAEGTPISKIGLKGNYQYSHCIVVLEEAFEFDTKTYHALREAIRGVDKMTWILRTNPWLASNWLIRRCFSTVPLDEEEMVTGSGNLFKQVGSEVYHYMRWDVNTKLPATQRQYLEEVRINNPQRARTVYYGLPGVHEGMVFASVVNKIRTEFAVKRWSEFTAGVDVGHVSSAMPAGLWALEPKALYKVAEYYHDNKTQKHLEAVDLARAILRFYQTQKDHFQFKELVCYVDSADPVLSRSSTPKQEHVTRTGSMRERAPKSQLNSESRGTLMSSTRESWASLENVLKPLRNWDWLLMTRKRRTTKWS